MTSNPSPDSNHRPDTLNDPGPQRIEGMPDILQLEKLDKLAGIYDDMVASPVYTTDDSRPDLAQIEAKIAEVKKTLLRDAGFVVEETGRTDDQRKAFEFADSVLDRAIRSNKEDWIGHTTPDHGHDGLSNQVFRELLARYYKPRRAIEDGPPKADDPEGAPDDDLETSDTLESAANVELKRRAAAMHKAYVNRLKGPLFPRVGLKKKLQEDYEAAERSYHELLDAVSQKDLKRWTDEGKTQEEIGRLISAQTNSRFQSDVEAQRQLLVTESGWLGRQLEKYANMSRGKKLAVTVGLGAAGLATGVGIGFGIGFVAGAVGVFGGSFLGGAITATGGRVVGAARMYKLRQADLFKKQTDLATFDATTLGDGTNTPTPEGIRRQSLDFIKMQSRAQIERGEKIKRRAVCWTMGSVAVGGLVGVGSHLLADGWSMDHMPGGQAQHLLSEKGIRLPWDHSGNQSSEAMATKTYPVEPAHPNEGTPPSVRYPEGSSGEHLDIANAITVEKGSGLIRETLQSANAAGYKIDTETAEKLYLATREHFGNNGIIDIENIKHDTYLQGNDLRLSAPGKAVWKDGVADFMEKWLEDHGHGVHNAVADTQDGSISVDEPGTDHFTRVADIQDGNISVDEPGTDHFTRVAEANASLAEAAQKTDAELIRELGGNATPPAVPLDGTDEEVLRSLGADMRNQTLDTASSSSVEQAIEKGSELPMNVVGHNEGWFDTFDELRKAGVVDIPKNHYDSFLKQVGPELSKLTYSDGTPVAYFNRRLQEWQMYDSPDGKTLLPDAVRVIQRFAERNNYDLAA